MAIRFPAEWERQDGILLPWPHTATDWADMLDRVEPVFTDIARETSRFEKVVIFAPHASGLKNKLVAAGAEMQNIHLLDIPTNDTWVRDYGPVTVYDNGVPLLLEFRFNGWGGKFRSDLDDRVPSLLARTPLFARSSLEQIDMVLEGGSIDSDGNGSLLTTSRCLLNPNRNPGMTRIDIEQTLLEAFGSERVLWLDYGMLLGDDTDSHVDILARFAPNDTILHVACDDPDDRHFEELEAMRTQLETFRTLDGKPYRLLQLPLPTPRHNDEGDRLAATYANFLAINEAVLVPTYDDPADRLACERIGRAFPGRHIIPVDCSPLIYEGGSLHCSTMHIPKGVLT